MKNHFPLNAKMVFQGKIFEVWQWEQKMFDGSTEIFERLKRANTAQVIAVVGDKILIQTQSQPDCLEPFLSLPGGRCDKNEDQLTAAKRELLEETGYASNHWTLWEEQNPVNKITWTIYTYIARDCVYAKEPHLDAGEKIQNKLITFDEFLTIPLDQRFYENKLALSLLRARLDPEFKKTFHTLLFGV